MHDVADIGFVDTHAKCTGRDHHHAAAPLHEFLLRADPFCFGHAAVITGNRDTSAFQRPENLVDSFRGCTVNDPRAAETTNQLTCSSHFDAARNVANGQLQIVPVRRRCDDRRLFHLQSADDVVLNFGGRGCSERQYRFNAQCGTLHTNA